VQRELEADELMKQLQARKRNRVFRERYLFGQTKFSQNLGASL
jgi:ABC-type Fe3+-hydroxamate transport system substrate-binding protein